MKFQICLLIILILAAGFGGWVSAAVKTFDSDLLPATDNVYSIGLQPGQLFKDAYFAGNLVVGGSLPVASPPIAPYLFSVTNNSLAVSATGQVYFNNLLVLGRLAVEPPTSTTLNGAIYYNNTIKKFRGLENKKWLDLVGGIVSSYWEGALNGDIYNNNSGVVGVGFKKTGQSYNANPSLGTKLLVKGSMKASQGIKFPDGRTWGTARNSVFSSLDLDSTLVNDGYVNTGKMFTIGTTPYFLYQKF